MSRAGGGLARSWAARVTGLAVVTAAVGCAPAPARPALAWPTTEELRAARARLERLRADASWGPPRTMKLSLAVKEPLGGRVMEARGAVAIAPEREGAPGALRMILVGPGGTTALDLWARGDRFRFSVPAIELLRRGDASTPASEMRGLPVGFLRWWLLGPARGDVVWWQREERADRFVLRDGAAFVDLRVADAGPVEAVRTTWAREGDADVVVTEERVEAGALGCARARYTTRIPLGGDGRGGLPLEIRIRCEGEERARAPSPRAFEDPDAPAAAAGAPPGGSP